MNSRILKLMAVMAVAVVLGGTAYGAARYAAGQVGPEEKPPTAVPTATAEPTATPLPEPTATPEPPPPPPTPTTEAKGLVTPAPLGCPDCRVKASDQIRVEVKDIQLGVDGKYFVPDRGDGCLYAEAFRRPGRLPHVEGLEEVILRAPGCEITITFVPATGEIRSTIS